MLLNAPINAVGKTNVVTTLRIFENIDEVVCVHKKAPNLEVRGLRNWLRGQDLNLRSRMRDYERSRPVSRKNPSPPFWRFKLSSSLRASDSVIGPSFQTNR